MIEIPVVAAVAIPVMTLVFGFILGMFKGESIVEKKIKADEKEVDQQRMWKEYIGALKEGNHGK